MFKAISKVNDFTYDKTTDMDVQILTKDKEYTIFERKHSYLDSRTKKAG